MNKSCDCKWGFKGADCGFPCVSVKRRDVCSLNPTKLRADCSSTEIVPCNGRGTFDSQDFRYQPARDDVYDCEPDGSCVCRRGYQGQACEIGECMLDEWVNGMRVLTRFRQSVCQQRRASLQHLSVIF